MIELAVVVTLIAFLATMLAPALFKATEKGKRVTCLGNLRQFGTAANLYSLDNEHRLLSSVLRPAPGGRWQPQYVYPGGAWTTNTWFSGQFNVAQMSVYIPGLRLDPINRQAEVPAVWWCPSMNEPGYRSVRKAGLFQGYFESSYSYFSGAAGWPRMMANKPQELTDNSLRGDRILMSDSLYYSSHNRAWSYNHGLRIGADHSPSNRFGVKDFGPPAVAGMNQLYGDGHVQWKAVNTNFAFRGGANGLGGVRGYLQDTTFH